METHQGLGGPEKIPVRSQGLPEEVGAEPWWATMNLKMRGRL